EIDVGTRDGGALARGEYRDRASVADRRGGIVGPTRPRANDQDAPAFESTRHLVHVRRVRTGSECTFRAMSALEQVAPTFVDMAHRIVWCSAATVDHQGRPRSRILHPLWEWDGAELVGWIATGPTPTKRA